MSTLQLVEPRYVWNLNPAVDWANVEVSYLDTGNIQPLPDHQTSYVDHVVDDITGVITEWYWLDEKVLERLALQLGVTR